MTTPTPSGDLTEAESPIKADLENMATWHTYKKGNKHCIGLSGLEKCEGCLYELERNRKEKSRG